MEETTFTSNRAPGGIQGKEQTMQKIAEALETNHYMILVTTLDQSSKKLRHHRHTRNFPFKEITPSLKHYNEEFRKDKQRGIK